MNQRTSSPEPSLLDHLIEVDERLTFREVKGLWLEYIKPAVELHGGIPEFAAAVRVPESSMRQYHAKGSPKVPKPGSPSAEAIHRLADAPPRAVALHERAWEIRPRGQGGVTAGVKRGSGGGTAVTRGPIGIDPEDLLGEWRQEINPELVVWAGRAWHRLGDGATSRLEGGAVESSIDQVIVESVEGGNVEGTMTRVSPPNDPPAWTFNGTFLFEDGWSLYLTYRETEGHQSRGLVALTNSMHDRRFLTGLYVSRRSVLDAESPPDEKAILNVGALAGVPDKARHTALIVPRPVLWRRPD